MKNNLPIWLEGHFDKIGQGSSHHAFLILGKKGLGKSLFAEYLAEKLLCQNAETNDCSSCFACNLENIDDHPDYHTLNILDGKKLISIEQFPELVLKLFETPFLQKNKVAVLNLDNCNHHGFNSLLKILEEPPKNTFFIFTSSFRHLIPETILSRCLNINIKTPSTEDALSWLSEFTEEEAKMSLSLTDNCPILAKEYLRTNTIQTREDFINDISGIIKSGKDIVTISKKWIEDLDTLPMKVEWMVKILYDTIKFHADDSLQKLTEDTDNISRYLSQNTHIEKVHNLLAQTNSMWSQFSSDSNLNKEYQLNSLFIDWEKLLGISKKV